MNPHNFQTILDNCIHRLRAGDTLDQCLADHPDFAADLLPLLAISVELSEVDPIQPHPLGSQMGRDAMFSAFDNEEFDTKPAIGWFGLLGQKIDGRLERLAGAFGSGRSLVLATRIIIALFIIGGSGGIFATASAGSLPGDQLYSVKRLVEDTRLAITLDEDSRANFEAELNERRIDELQELQEIGRSGSVAFSGIIEAINQDSWLINGIEVNLIPELRNQPEIAVGQSVAIETEIGTDGTVTVSDLNPLIIDSSIEPPEFLTPESQATQAIAAIDPLKTPTPTLTPPTLTLPTAITEIIAADNPVRPTRNSEPTRPVEPTQAPTLPALLTATPTGEVSETPERPTDVTATATRETVSGLTPTPTQTVEPNPTETATATETIVDRPEATITSTATNEATATTTPTATASPILTITPTAVETVVVGPTRPNEPTLTATPTINAQATATATAENTQATREAAATATQYAIDKQATLDAGATAEFVPTQTPEWVPTETGTPAPIETPTHTPTFVPSPTLSPTETSTPSPAATLVFCIKQIGGQVRFSENSNIENSVPVAKAKIIARNYDLDIQEVAFTGLAGHYTLMLQPGNWAIFVVPIDESEPNQWMYEGDDQRISFAASEADEEIGVDFLVVPN